MIGLPGLAQQALPQRGSSRRQQPQQQPQLQSKHQQLQPRREAPRLSSSMLFLELWLLFWLLPTRRATLRQGSLSQASQANQGSDSQMGLDIFVIRLKARLITRPPISDKSNDLIHWQQEGGIARIYSVACQQIRFCLCLPSESVRKGPDSL